MLSNTFETRIFLKVHDGKSLFPSIVISFNRTMNPLANLKKDQGAGDRATFIMKWNIGTYFLLCANIGDDFLDNLHRNS